jgi:RNA polymerase sigma factor (sigma-70 family)
VSKLQLGQIITGIQQRDHKILSDIYRVYYPLVLGHIIHNGGNDAEAKDVFQESIIIVYKLIQNNELSIKEDFESYLVGIAKKIWLKKIRQDTIHEKFVSKSNPDIFENHPSDQEIENELEHSLIRKHILNLGNECRQVLLLTSEGLSNEEIAKKLGYKNDKSVISKRHKCKAALIDLIKEDPQFKHQAR